MLSDIKNFLLGGISLTIVNISQKAVNFLVLPLFTYYLSPKDFGIVSIYFLIISFLSMFYNPGVISATTRLYYDNESNSLENKKLISTSFSFLIIVPIIILLFSCFFGEKVFHIFFKDINFWPYGFLAVIGAIMTQPIRLWSNYYIILGKTKIISQLTLIQIIISVGLSLLFVVVLKYGAIGRIYGVLIGNTFLYVFAIILIIRKVGISISFNKIKTLLILGFPLMFSVFAYVILDVSDRYLISEIIGVDELGMYDISYTLSSIPLFVILGFNQVWQPLFYEKMNEQNYSTISKINYYFISTFALITSLLIIFSNEMFSLFINHQYIKGIQIAPWIIIGIFFLGINNFFNSILMYYKKFKQSGVISVIVAAINIIINLALLPIIGILGSAIATFISYLIYFCLLIYLTKKEIKFIFDKRIIIPFFYIFIITFLTILLNNYFPIFNLNLFVIKIIVVLIIIFLSSLFLFKKEYSFILNYLKKKTKKNTKNYLNK